MSEDSKAKDQSMSTNQNDEANQMIKQFLTQIERKVEEDQFQRQNEQAEIKS